MKSLSMMVGDSIPPQLHTALFSLQKIELYFSVIGVLYRNLNYNLLVITGIFLPDICIWRHHIHRMLVDISIPATAK